ncbi:histidine kinase [Crinalium epipsammum PCC 9333]|uniref:histidine kinase n=1 Tax=Crinalium epipsammum PCC 9333 TaxID=1173022 RepID=K9VSQ3_9CYAN|nr:HAMP domain-containing sensor histidine kinase [Crinalium epipsammum]AFZ11073.1 histidine kinase [Crinalium epipsammum PCC 9333]
MVQKWLFPTVSEILAQNQTSLVGQIVMDNAIQRVTNRTAREQEKAEREWCGAIASLEKLLTSLIDTSEYNYEPSVNGLVLAAPVPVLSNPQLISHFKTGIFTADSFNHLALMPFKLPPATASCCETINAALELPLIAADPLTMEQFCVVFTRQFSLVMVLGEDIEGNPAFQFSFDPEDILQVWRSLRARIILTNPHQLPHLDQLVQEFTPIAPDYRIVMEFTRQLLKHLPEEMATPSNFAGKVGCDRAATSQEYRAATPQEYQLEIKSKELDNTIFHSQDTWSEQLTQNFNQNSPDVELLQALTHEIRTPLTTIRTLTKLLLKRRELAPEVIKRLEIIDHECTEQINRMELIFRGVELATSTPKQAPVHLTTISLTQLLQQSIPRWQQQAKRRNLTLEIDLPQKLPTVITNPAMLDQVLTGLMENFTRNLPAGGHIQIEVTPAGNQLKLQLQSQLDLDENSKSTTDSRRKLIGQLLMFQPETGSLSLNMNVTKNLFQALGGKLIVRQRPQQGEVLTIFLPLNVSNTEAITC